MTTNTKGVFDNVAVNTLGAPNAHRFGHIVFMTLENQNYTSIIGNPNMPYLNSLFGRGCAAHEFLRQLSPLAARLFRADDGTELLYERRAACRRARVTS